MNRQPILPLLFCVFFLSQVAGAAAPGDGETPTTPNPAANVARDLKLGQAPAYDGVYTSLASLNVRNAQVQEVLTGLKLPWAFEFLTEDEIILTERFGSLQRINIKTGEAAAIAGLPAIATDHEQTGLLDVEVHPDFAMNQRLYFSYTASDSQSGRYYLTKVATAILKGNALTDVKDLLAAGPMSWSPSNFGGALEFDDKGFLYISVGDRSERDLAQMRDRLQGKILRLHDDGRTPRDNPFVDDPTMDDRVFAWGVRNPQGLHFDSQSSSLIETEHGPMGGDEVNLLQAGGNYGWPTITYGKDYTTAKIGKGTHQPNLLQPLYYFLPSTAISPVTMYRGVMFPEWDGDLLIGALKGRHLAKLDFDQGRIRSSFALLPELKARIRDVKVASDGSIYILAQRGSLFRVFRNAGPDAVVAKPDVSGEAIYQLVCAGCHDSGSYGAPMPEKPDQWALILGRPIEETYRRSIEGFGAMPRRGLCEICDDDLLKATVDYMLDGVRAKN